MKVFVIDNSVVSGWLLQNQATAYSDAVATLLQTQRAVAPPLLRLEYTNVLRTACKRQRLVAEQAYEMLAMLGELPIDVDTAVGAMTSPLTTPRTWMWPCVEARPSPRRTRR